MGIIEKLNFMSINLVHANLKKKSCLTLNITKGKCGRALKYRPNSYLSEMHISCTLISIGFHFVVFDN